MAHPQQMNFIKEISSKYSSFFKKTNVLEVGSWNVNGTVRDFFIQPVNYIGLDIAPGKDVDVVCDASKYDTNLRFDVTISCECFEHNPEWVKTFGNMIRLTKSGGLIVMTCATDGRPEHGTPIAHPDASLSSSFHSYYKNLNESNFRDEFKLDEIFDSYEFTVNEESKDLYFYGIKKSNRNIDHITNEPRLGNHVIYNGEYLILCMPDNQFFSNIINFLSYKFDNEEYRDNIIIVSGNYLCIDYLRLKYPSKKLIAYNWEQLVGCNQWLNADALCRGIKSADEIWDYDYLNKSYLNKYHNIEVNKVYPFAYYPNIEKLRSYENPVIDVLFYGLLNQRRSKILTGLQQRFYDKVSIVSVGGMSVEDTYKFIENSKIVLNLHAFEPWSRQEQERIGFLLGNQKCVLSEISQENYFSDAIVESTIEQLGTSIQALLSNDNWRTIANSGYKKFKHGECTRIVNF